jgi:superfamily II DNA helicase RecQ
VAQGFRGASKREREMLRDVLAGLRGAGVVSTGKLHKQLAPAAEISRDDFEDMLGALARLNLVRLEPAVFEKDGREIHYVRASLTEDGYQLRNGAEIEFLMKTKVAAPARARKRKTMPGFQRASARSASPPSAPARAADPVLEQKLRDWRLAEAKRLGLRAFQIFGDRTLQAIAAERPGTTDELLDVEGIGPQKAERFGAAICRICRGS